MVKVLEIREGRLLAILVACALAAALAPVQSQADYSFSVDRNHVDVYIESSGLIKINYELTFSCDPSGDAIDIVDIGLPSDQYLIKSARSDLDGSAVSEIKPSEYVHPGLEVHLGGSKIPPGRSGTLHFYVECLDALYQDTKDNSYASFRFSPTWYGSEYTSGTTDLAVSFHFPKGVSPDETRWHDKQFDITSRDSDGRIVFTWADPVASPSTQYMYGVSFPKKYLQSDAIVKKAPSTGGGGGGGGSSAGFIILLFFAIFIIAIIGSSISQKKRLMQYMPPSLAIEGVGIKRGLTAVEAAVLLEKPLDKVCTMILFGLLRKRAVKVVKDRPLRLEVAEKSPEGLYDYETAVLGAIDNKGGIAEGKLAKAVVSLIKSTNEKMKGFSRRETKEYYNSIVNKAWEQVKSGETPEIASEALDKELEWLMADEKYDEKMRTSLGDRTLFWPVWLPAQSAAAPGAAPAATPGIGPSGIPRVSVPSLPGADFANSVAKSIESFSHGLVSKVESFTSGVTKSTNPPPVSTSSGRSGSGCACACACAGCACACAGGGR
jgi:hypothetical protein